MTHKELIKYIENEMCCANACPQYHVAPYNIKLCTCFKKEVIMKIEVMHIICKNEIEKTIVELEAEKPVYKKERNTLQNCYFYKDNSSMVGFDYGEKKIALKADAALELLVNSYNLLIKENTKLKDKLLIEQETNAAFKKEWQLCEAENAKLKEALFIQGSIYEDDLPELTPEQFNLAMDCSKVDGVRLYPKLLVEALKEIKQ